MKLPDDSTVWTPAGLRHARRRPAGHADLRQRRGPGVPPHHHGRRQVPVHGRRRGHQQGRGAGHALSLRADLAPRHAEARGLLHPARRPDRRARRAGPAGGHLQLDRRQEERSPSRRPTPGSASPTSTGRRRCMPDTKADLQARFSVGPVGTQKTYQTDYLGDAQTVAPGATATHNTRLFAGAKEVAVVDGYEKQLDLNRFDLLIDWGWFYFITKPMFLAIDWIYHRVGNFGVAILIDHRADQDRVLPARQQVLRLDGEDEGGAAGDDGDPRALRRRQDEAAAGADGALQEGEDQSAGGLPADPDPDPGVLRALQGAVRHHRDAARAVLRLDQGSLGARPDQPLQPVRADPVRSDA